MERAYPKSLSVKKPAIEAICSDLRVWNRPQIYLGNFEQAGSEAPDRGGTTSRRKGLE